MNDKSSNALLLLIIAGLLVLSGLMGYMWYRYATQPAVATQAAPVVKKEQALASVRDSLQQAYQQTLTALPTTASVKDSLNASYDSLEFKMAELAKLKEEVDELLQKNSTLAELETARLKILELQTKIEELRRKTLLIEEENKRLNAALNKLVRRNTTEAATTTLSFRSEPRAATAVAPAPEIFLSDWRLTGLSNATGNEAEAKNGEEVEKLKGSFSLKASQSFSAEFFIVVRQPDGRVLQTAWEGGAFESLSGRKMYSCKLVVDYAKGEEKRLSFSIPTEGLQKGAYTMQVYYNGVLAGSSRAVL